MWNRRTCDFGSNKACKINKYLDIKNCSCEKRLGKLVLGFEDEILNTTETTAKDLSCPTPFVDKNVIYENNDCAIYIISLIIICLFLLVAISFSCCFYYAKNWLKNECLLLYQYKITIS